MTFAYHFYNEAGIREDHPPVIVDDLDVEQVPNKSLLFDGYPYVVIGIVRDSKIEGSDDPIDVVKVRRKPN